ncbi:hypothetical protein BHM03_00060054 [Ensete ventricosum]|nr:hypothetical protein BHM03_00060054 [Ensete ventricosum]
MLSTWSFNWLLQSLFTWKVEQVAAKQKAHEKIRQCSLYNAFLENGPLLLRPIRRRARVVLQGRPLTHRDNRAGIVQASGSSAATMVDSSDSIDTHKIRPSPVVHSGTAAALTTTRDSGKEGFVAEDVRRRGWQRRERAEERRHGNESAEGSSFSCCLGIQAREERSNGRTSSVQVDFPSAWQQKCSKRYTCLTFWRI